MEVVYCEFLVVVTVRSTFVVRTRKLQGGAPRHGGVGSSGNCIHCGTTDDITWSTPVNLSPNTSTL